MFFNTNKNSVLSINNACSRNFISIRQTNRLQIFNKLKKSFTIFSLKVDSSCIHSFYLIRSFMLRSRCVCRVNAWVCCVCTSNGTQTYIDTCDYYETAVKILQCNQHACLSIIDNQVSSGSSLQLKQGQGNDSNGFY